MCSYGWQHEKRRAEHTIVAGHVVIRQGIKTDPNDDKHTLQPNEQGSVEGAEAQFRQGQNKKVGNAAVTHVRNKSQQREEAGLVVQGALFHLTLVDSAILNVCLIAAKTCGHEELLVVEEASKGSGRVWEKTRPGNAPSCTKGIENDELVAPRSGSSLDMANAVSCDAVSYGNLL